MKRYFTSAIVIIMLLIIACESTIAVKKDMQLDHGGLSVSCLVNKIKIKKVSARDKELFNIKAAHLSYIYGDIKLTNSTDKTITYSLTNYYLSNGVEISSKIYIDSVASRIISPKSIRPGETIKEYVYWVFDDAMSAKELDGVLLIFR